MSKVSMKTEKRNNLKAFIAKKVAENHEITVRQVYRVLAGDSENEEVFTDYMTMYEEVEQTLVNAVKKLVPF